MLSRDCNIRPGHSSIFLYFRRLHQRSLYYTLYRVHINNPKDQESHKLHLGLCVCKYITVARSTLKISRKQFDITIQIAQRNTYKLLSSHFNDNVRPDEHSNRSPNLLNHRPRIYSRLPSRMFPFYLIQK